MAQGALSLQRVFYQDDMAAHKLTGIFYRLMKREKDLTKESPDVEKAMNYAWSCSAAFKHPSFFSGAAGSLSVCKGTFRGEALLSYQCGANQKILPAGPDVHVPEDWNWDGGPDSGDYHRAGIYPGEIYPSGLSAG